MSAGFWVTATWLGLLLAALWLDTHLRRYEWWRRAMALWSGIRSRLAR